MKNLENYGVRELNAKEIRETDGGDWNQPWYIEITGLSIPYEMYNYIKGKYEQGCGCN